MSNTPTPSRREFLVMVGAVAVGTFALPALVSRAASAINESAAAAVREQERIRHLLAAPVKTAKGDRFVLAWLEMRGESAADIAVMTWEPETPGELAEAQRFYEAAHGGHAAPAKKGFWKKLFSGSDVPRARPPAEQALLDAIIDHPEQHALWLAYGDHLEKQGDPLGTFIRLDRELEQLDIDDPRRDAVDKQFMQLANKHGRKWLKPLAALGLEPVVMGTYFAAMWLTEGLVTELTITRPGILPERAAELFAAAPALMRLDLSFDGLNIPAIAALPQMQQIHGLTLSDRRLTAEDLRALASSPHLQRLRHLDLSFNTLTPELLQILTDAALFGRLRSLRLVSCDIDDAGAGLIAAAPGRLEKLVLESNELTATGLAAIGKSRHLENLRELDLSANGRISDEGVAALSGAAFLPRLEALSLNRCSIGAPGFIEMARWPCEALAILRIDDNVAGPTALGPAGIDAMAASALFRRLTLLQMDGNNLGEQGVRAMVHSPQLKGLRELHCDRNDLGDSGAERVAQWTDPPKLRKLELRDNGIGPAGIRALAASPLTTGLTELYLDRNPIGDDGAQALAASPHLQKLRTLSLDAGDLPEAGLAALRARFGDSLST